MERTKPDTCNVSGCGGPTHSAGYCLKHYFRAYRHGLPRPCPPEYAWPLKDTRRVDESTQRMKTCGVAGCGLVYATRGYCRHHYQKARAGGHPVPCPPNFAWPLDEPKDAECGVVECGKPTRSMGYCRSHYQMAWLKGLPMPCPRDYVWATSRRKSNGEKRKCSVQGCSSRHRSMGYCAKHYSYAKYKGLPTPCPDGLIIQKQR